jgi:hypothetical protein
VSRADSREADPVQLVNEGEIAMPLEEMQRLSRKLLASSLREDGQVNLYINDYAEHISVLPDRVRGEVEELMTQIRSIIPTDFSFNVSFELEGARLWTVFQDGNTEADAFEGFFKTRKSIFRRLRDIPWDELRADLINRGGIFEELVRDADDRPVNIPSSQKAAGIYITELSSEVSKIQHSRPRPPFALIIARDDLGVSSELLPSREAVVFTIADRMTTLNDILAVLENGVPWSFQEIESAKLEAVEQLGPISRAKAEGRFVFSDE